jgi:tetratricopeptide (TPR) repeat protein
MNSGWRIARRMVRVIFGYAWLISMMAAQDTPPLGARDLSPVRMGTPAELKMPVGIPRGYAIVIGISDYKNLPPQYKLRFADKDADSVYSALLSKAGGNIEFSNVIKLIGSDATLANMRNALEKWLPGKAQPADRVVVFFVGHGIVDRNGRGYLAPYDVNLSNIAETAYPMDRLGQVLSRDVKAGWKVLLVDACHSGQITVNSTIERVNDSLRGLPQGVLTLTSSHASEKSYEDPALAGGNGIFTYFLVHGWLGEADVDPADGKVTADELVSYVRREVRAYTRKQGEQQTPWESGDFPDDLILGYNPERRSQLAAKLEEPATGNLIIEVNLADVSISVDGALMGPASPGASLKIPGLAAGHHKIEGARKGYDPVSIDINVVPGGTQTVSLQLLYPRTTKPSAKALFDEGDATWKRSNASQSNLAKASELFSKALKADPSYSAAALELCRVEQMRGNTREALTACARAVQIDTDYVEARSQYGTVLLENGDYPEAVRQFQRASTQDPKNPFTHSLFAEALYWADRPQDAEAEANNAIKLDNSSAQAYLMRAEARRSQKRFDEAVEDYQKALRLHEYSSGFLRVAAYWTIGTGMTKNRSGRQALYRSQTATAYYGLCACENGKQDYHQSVNYCKRALAIDANDTDSHILLADSYAALFNEENRRDYLVQTKQNLEETLRINPSLDSAPNLRSKLKEINEILTGLR